EILPTFGSLAARNFVSRMGYFNPHVDSSFMLSAFGYVRHWAKYYLFSRRSLAAAWAVGTVRSLVQLAKVRDRGDRRRNFRNIEACARETGADRKRIVRHAAMCSRPAHEKPVRIARELWLDRVGVFALALVVACLWLVFARGALLAGAAIAPVMLLGYE